LFLRNSGRKIAAHFSWNCSSRGGYVLKLRKEGRADRTIYKVNWLSDFADLRRMATGI